MINRFNTPFSVLMSVYNRDNPEHFHLALESLFFQKLQPDEIVLVKDGPLTPELLDVINFFHKKDSIPMKVINLEYNQGLGSALNVGLNLCKHQLVARMDSDDICVAERFEKQINFLDQNPDVSVVGCVVEEFNDEIRDLNRFRKLPLTPEDILKFSKYRNPVNHPSVVFRKDHILKVGSYLEMPLFEDYYLWIRMLMSGYKIANQENVLLNFRIGNDMIGRRHGLSYLKKEIHFLNTIRDFGYISFQEYIFSVITKVPLRMLPKKILKIIYKQFLR